MAKLLVDDCPHHVVIVTYDSEYEEDTIEVVIVGWAIVCPDNAHHSVYF